MSKAILCDDYRVCPVPHKYHPECASCNKDARAVLCTILWWDKRDGIGIACDSKDNEIYIDRSVIDRPELCRDGLEVTLVTHRMGGCLCGANVKVSLESAVERQALTVRVLEAHGPEGMIEGYLDEAKSELSRLAAMLIRSTAC